MDHRTIPSEWIIVIKGLQHQIFKGLFSLEIIFLGLTENLYYFFKIFNVMTICMWLMPKANEVIMSDSLLLVSVTFLIVLDTGEGVCDAPN